MFGSIPSDSQVIRFLGRLVMPSPGALGGTGDAALGAGGSGGLEDSSTNTVFDIKSSSSLSLPESHIYSDLAPPVEVTRLCVCD